MVKISIGRVNKTKPHLFADAVEVLCAFGNDSPLSKTDAFTLLQNAVVPGDESLPIDEPDIDDNNFDDSLGGVEITSRTQGYIDECFRQIEYRILEFGDAYPFEIEEEAIVLKPNLTERHKVYLSLLASARIRTFGEIKGLKQKLADLFEVTSLQSLKRMLPGDAEVVAFGPNSVDRKDRFGANLLEALPRLAEFMGMSMTPGWDAELKPQGDAGIDLVGVQSLDDGQGGWNVFLAQCAAHEEPETWSKKRSEAKIAFYNYLFTYSVESQAVLFIPGCFRQPNGQWAARRYTDGVIIMDRVRILKLIEVGNPIEASISEFLNTHLMTA